MSQECHAYVISRVKNAPVAVTTDAWTSKSTQSYVTITTSRITLTNKNKAYEPFLIKTMDNSN